jgi:uncharacterized protein (DUF3084 family)
VANPLIELLGLPPRLATQTLDDIHQIATGGRTMIRLLAGLEERADRVQDQLDAMLAAAESLNDMGERVLTLVERLDERAVAVLALGSQIDSRGKEMVALASELDSRAGALLGLGQQIDERGASIVTHADLVATRAAEVVAVLPTLEKAVAIASPLEGAVERLGRMVDRLPGEARRRGGS